MGTFCIFWWHEAVSVRGTRVPRTARASVGDYCYHVINRGNGCAEVFHAEGDYQAFVIVLKEAGERVPMRVLSYGQMPHHVHLAVWQYRDGDLNKWMQWLLTAHVRRYYRWHESSGHVWQGRFKAFPIEQDAQLLTVLRYIEQHPVRAGRVSRVEESRGSSAPAWRDATRAGALHVGPVPRPEPWLDWVNRPMEEAEVQHVRQSVNRGGHLVLSEGLNESPPTWGWKRAFVPWGARGNWRWYE